MPPVGRGRRGEGWGAPVLPASGCVHQIGDATMRRCVVFVLSFHRCLASVRVESDLNWLQLRCMRWQLRLSYGDPPRDLGMSSSTSPRWGWGRHPGQTPPGHFFPCPPGVVVSVLSTRSPQRAQWVSSALTRLVSSRRRWPLALCLGAAKNYPPPGVIGGRLWLLVRRVLLRFHLRGGCRC